MLLAKGFFLFISLLLLNGCNIGLALKDSPKVEAGVLNLTFWDFEKQGAVNLEGEWEFYWKKIYRPSQTEISKELLSGYFEFPGYWNGRIVDKEILSGDGYATFKVKVMLPESMHSIPKKKLALRMKEQATAYELYLGNELLTGRGRIGTNPKESTPGYGTETIFFETNQQSFELTLIVSNYHHRNGGIWSIPILGTQDQILQLKYERNSIEFLLGGSILIMTIYHFMLFIFRKNDLTSLYFASFCLVTLMRVISTGEIMIVQLIPNIHYEVVTKFEYMSFFLLISIFFKFFYQLFPDDVSDLLVKISMSIGGVLSMIVCFSSLRLYNYFVNPNYVVIITIIVIIYIYQVRLVVKRREDALVIFLFSNFLILFIVNDILYNLKVIVTGELMQIGVFIFLLAQSVILSRRFSRAFRDIEDLSNHLTLVNAAYSNFVPREFLSILNKESITEVSLGNLAQRDVTILVSGIKGFSAISERLSPKEIFELLNEYYIGITAIIRKKRGFIGKFIGDEIMVLFPDFPQNAILAATEMNQYTHSFNLKNKKLGKSTFNIGVGIHSGNVTFGTLGGIDRMDTTVIGSPVEMAQKLETLANSFFVNVLISSDTYLQLEKKERELCREIEYLKIQGTEGFLTVYEYFGADTEDMLKKKKNFNAEYFRGLTLFRGGFFDKAEEIFTKCKTILPEDPILALYINRCRDKTLSDSVETVEANSNKPEIALIICRDEEFTIRLEKALKKEKMDVITTKTAQEAISICSNIKPKILFMNIHMVDMNAKDLIEKLRVEQNLSVNDTYIVAITSDSSQLVKSVIYESGADDFIMDKFHPDSLNQIISRVLNR